MTEADTTFRDQLATERGISNEDRDLLMTGADEDTLTRQADLLAPRPDRRMGNRAPKEGLSPKPYFAEDEDMRGFTRDLFNNTDDLD